jgi:4-hydroxy-3-methylbut-2-enyl diphosphate reductase
VRECDVLIVVGSVTSSNSNRLRRARPSAPACRLRLVDGADGPAARVVRRARCVGVTAGASAPEVLVQEVVGRLVEWGAEPPRELPGQAEHVVFGLPRGLRTG